MMLHSGKIPDVAIFRACHNIIRDIRTVVGADSRYCAAAALFPGHGAVWGAARKKEAWLSHTMAQQGDVFYALCHEAGGRMGDSAHDLLDLIVDSAGGSASDRMSFRIYALQRLHVANFRGVAAVINSRPAMCTPPPECGMLPLVSARPKPVINFRGHGCTARHALTKATRKYCATARLTSSA